MRAGSPTGLRHPILVQLVENEIRLGASQNGAAKGSVGILLRPRLIHR